MYVFQLLTCMPCSVTFQALLAPQQQLPVSWRIVCRHSNAICWKLNIFGGKHHPVLQSLLTKSEMKLVNLLGVILHWMCVDLANNSYQAHNNLDRLDKVCVSYLKICCSATHTLLNEKLTIFGIMHHQGLIAFLTKFEVDRLKPDQNHIKVWNMAFPVARWYYDYNRILPYECV